MEPTDRAVVIEEGSPLLQAPERDCLSTLPPELLVAIFNEVYVLNKNHQMRGAICRILTRYTRTNLFKRVRLSNWRQLELFVQGSGEVTHLVEGLTIRTRVRRERLDKDVEASSPSNDQLVPFFRTLVRLRDLCIDGSSRIARLVLSTRVACVCFPALDSLGLIAEFSSWSNPFDPSHYANLNMYPTLNAVTLDISRAESSIQPGDSDSGGESSSDSDSASDCESDTDPDESTREAVAAIGDPAGAGETDRRGADLRDTAVKGQDVRKHAKIRSLNITGPLGHPSAPAIMDIVPDPTSLSLAATEQIPSFVPFLERVELPQLVGFLALYNELALDSASVDDALLAFSDLDVLVVTPGITGPKLFTHFLRDPLPLEELTLCFGVEATEEQLLNLVRGPTRLASLQTLLLDMVDEGKIGTRIKEDAHGQVCKWTTSGAYSDWDRPQWTPDLDHRAAKRVVVAARKAGLLVEGSLLDALEWEKKRKAEKKLARRIRNGDVESQ